MLDICGLWPQIIYHKFTDLHPKEQHTSRECRPASDVARSIQPECGCDPSGLNALCLQVGVLCLCLTTRSAHDPSHQWPVSLEQQLSCHPNQFKCFMFLPCWSALKFQGQQHEAPGCETAGPSQCRRLRSRTVHGHVIPAAQTALGSRLLTIHKVFCPPSWNVVAHAAQRMERHKATPT